MNKFIKKIILFISFCFLFLLSCKHSNNEIDKIKTEGIIRVGMTGDYQPMSFYNYDDQTYEGFDVGLVEELANSLGVKIEYVKTSWPTLMEDLLNNKFDIALSGITITKERKQKALMSIGYINNGKTVLCRKEDENKYINLESINKNDVVVMENPGGLNEKFARENLPNAQLVIHNKNEEIPQLIIDKKADVMITEIVEAMYYVSKDNRLSAPLVNSPFTKGEIGILMQKNYNSLLKYINKFLEEKNKSGTIEELKKKYIYGYEKIN